MPGVFGQAGMFGGIALSHDLEIRLGLREGVEGVTTLVDSLAMLLQFNAAGRLLHGMAPGLGRRNQEFQLRGEPRGPARSPQAANGGFYPRAFHPDLLPRIVDPQEPAAHGAPREAFRVAVGVEYFAQDVVEQKNRRFEEAIPPEFFARDLVTIVGQGRFAPRAMAGGGEKTKVGLLAPREPLGRTPL